MRLLTNDDVAEVLTMRETMDALRVGYKDLLNGDACYIPRIDIFAPTGRLDDYYQWGSMAGVCTTYGVLAVRMKSDIVSWPDGRTQEKYCVRPGLYSGVILLYSTKNGEPLAIIQDGLLQHLRVGASAGLGADLLAREDADTLGLLGSGGMAETYLEAISAVRSLRSVRVYSPTPEHRERFAMKAQKDLDLSVEATATAEDAVRGCSIVATATDSLKPTLEPEWISSGAHVTCVTRRELSPELIARADRVVQLGVSTIPYGSAVPGMEWKTGSIAAYVAGQPHERARIPKYQPHQGFVFPSMLDVQRGRVEGRSSPEEITLFVNTGTQGLQFAAVGARTLQLAVEHERGTGIPVEWFLEDIRD